jgi:hypothetical protein
LASYPVPLPSPVWGVKAVLPLALGPPSDLSYQLLPSSPPKMGALWGRLWHSTPDQGMGGRASSLPAPGLYKLTPAIWGGWVTTATMRRSAPFCPVADNKIRTSWDIMDLA